MKVVKFCAFRAKLRIILDECERTNEPVMVESINNQMVVISKEKYDMMVSSLDNKGKS